MCSAGRSDEYLGLVGRLVMELGTARADPGPSVLGWAPWPDVQHRGANDACRCDCCFTVSKTYRHSAPPSDTILGRLVLPLLLGFFFTKFYSQTGKSTLEKNDPRKSALTEMHLWKLWSDAWSCGPASGLSRARAHLGGGHCRALGMM